MPLSPAQIALHWSAAPKMGWARVCDANSWHFAGGRICPDACKSAYGGWHAEVWKFAEEIAAREARALTKDDLRKGTYLLALGELKSLKVFNNADFDRVLAAFAVLIDPDNLTFVQKFLAFQRVDAAKRETRQRGSGIHTGRMALPDDPGERKRRLYWVQVESKTPEAVIRAICRDKFGGKSIDDLDLDEVRQLSTTLKNRRAYEDRIAVRQPEGGSGTAMDDGDPF